VCSAQRKEGLRVHAGCDGLCAAAGCVARGQWKAKGPQGGDEAVQSPAARHAASQTVCELASTGARMWDVVGEKH